MPGAVLRPRASGARARGARTHGASERRHRTNLTRHSIHTTLRCVAPTNWSHIVMVTPTTLYQRLPSLKRRQRRIAVIAAFAGFPLLNLGYAALVASGIVPTTI